MTGSAKQSISPRKGRMDCFVAEFMIGPAEGGTQAMDIDPVTQGFIDHRESIDIIGEVKCWVRDLEEAWQKENIRLRNEVTRDKAAMVIEFDIAAPRPTVWEYFTLPGQRPKWRGADEVREMPESGRRGVGRA